MNRPTRAAAILGSLGLAGAGLAAAPAVQAALPVADPGCAVSYTTAPAYHWKGGGQLGLPKEIDFGPNGTNSYGYAVVFHGKPGSLATGFTSAQVRINGDTSIKTDGFTWTGHPALAADGTAGLIWKPNPVDFTAGKTYSLDHNDSHAVENDAAAHICDFHSLGAGSFFYAKGQTQVAGVTFIRHGAKLTVVPVTQRFILADRRFESVSEPVQLFASSRPDGSRAHLVATGTTNAAGKFAFQVNRAAKQTYFVVIPTTAFGTTSSSPSYSK